ncbi:MAG: AAA family ATPase [Gemmatimonadaceae bacterium]|nr:AAA family ATPase [Gemmatimonadaceae bacterium]
MGMNTEVLFALGLYLTTRAGERVPREDILHLLWGDEDGATRRHALRQLLYRLREKGLTLDEDGDVIRLDAARVDSDVRSALASDWCEQASGEAIIAAGEPMPVFSRRMSGSFLAWYDELRERVLAQHRKAALLQIGNARREGRWADLERWAQPILRSDPFNEEATMARAESAAMAGSKTRAIEILDTYLSEVGDISPELGKPALALRKRLAERRADWVQRGPREVPLVGRADLMRRLTGLVEAAWRGEGGAVMLVGAPGIGKTRLAMEARAYAELKGMRTVVIRAEAGMGEVPLAVPLAIGRELLATDEVNGSSPATLGLLRRIARTTDVMTFMDSDDVRPSSDQYVAALSDALVACQSARRYFVLVEDAHWIDEDSREVLAVLASRLVQKRICFVLTSRSAHTEDGSRPHPAWSTVRVPPLDLESSSQLAQRTAHAHSSALSTETAGDIASVGGGNPLFVRELSLQATRREPSVALPTTLESVIGDRLSRLRPAPLALLRTVLLLGSEATAARVREVSSTPAPDFGSAIEALEDDGIVTAHSDGVLSLHECWRRTLAASLSPATASALSLRCADALLAEGESSLSASGLWKASDLYRSAGMSAKAQLLCEAAARRYYDAGLIGQSIDVFRRAVDISPNSAAEPRVRIGLARALLAAGRPKDSIQSLNPIRASGAHGFEDTRETAASALALETEASAKLCMEHSRLLAGMLESASDRSMSTEFRLALCMSVARLAANAHEHAIERKNAALVDSLRSELPRNLSGLLAAMIFRTEHGPSDELFELHATVETGLFGAVGTTSWCASQRILAHSLRLHGFCDRALSAAARAHSRASQAALPDDAAIAAELCANIALDYCNLEAARQWINSAEQDSLRPDYRQRSIALRHLDDRIRIDSGDVHLDESSARERLDEVRTDPVIISRVTRLASLAMHGAMARIESIAVDSATGAASDVTGLLGHSAADYPIELLARTAKLLPGLVGIAGLSERHVRERDLRFMRPLPPFYAELHEARRILARRGDSQELTSSAFDRQ